MNGFWISTGLALAAMAALVQDAAGQRVPAYQKLDADKAAPPKLQIEPVMLSRFPTTQSIAIVAGGERMRTVDINGRVWQRTVRQADEPLLIADTKCEPACAVLSNDARCLAWADAEGKVAVLDLEKNTIRFEDESAADRTVALTFSGEGRLLAGVTIDGKVRVWEAGRGKLVRELAADAGPVQSIAFSPAAGQLAVASFSRDVKLYPLTRQEPSPAAAEPRVIQSDGARITAVAFSPDGKQLVIATADGKARVHDLTTERTPIELGTHPFAIWSIAFERNGRRLAAGSWDGTIKLWDATSWEPLQSLKKHEESVASIVFDDRLGLHSAGLDGRLLSWLPEVPSTSPAGMIAGRDDSVWAAVYSPDGKRLFVGGRGHRFEMWDAENNVLLVSRAGHPTTRCAAFSPDGTTLATGGDDGNILLCDGFTGTTRTTLLRHPGAVSAVVFADEGRTLISACDGGVVKRWDADTGRQQASWHEHRQQVYCAAVSPDGKWLLTGGGNWTNGEPGELLLWELATGRVHGRLAGHKLAVWTIVFMPDGQRFLSSDSSGAVKVWNFDTLAEERTLQHTAWVRPLALSPNGKTLAVGRGDGSVRLWDTATWTERASCDGHKSFTFSLQFAPDGRTLASGGVDGTVRFWHPDEAGPTDVNRGAAER